jgi:hypothetical protein
MFELRATPSYIRYLPPDGDELLAVVTLGRDADVAQRSAATTIMSRPNSNCAYGRRR